MSPEPEIRVNMCQTDLRNPESRAAVETLIAAVVARMAAEEAADRVGSPGGETQ